MKNPAKKKLTIKKLQITKIDNLIKIKGGSKTCNSEIEGCTELCKSANC